MGRVGGGGGGQVGVHSAVAGTVVREGVWSLGHRGSDVGLFASVAPGAICGNVLLSLEKDQEGHVEAGGGDWTHASAEEHGGSGQREEEEGAVRTGRKRK